MSEQPVPLPRPACAGTEPWVGTEPWPGASDPAALLSGIADWLTGYGNVQTRRTYAEGLGLPVTSDDVEEWVRTITASAASPASTPDGGEPQAAFAGSGGAPGADWREAVAAYAAALQLKPPAADGAARRPPPAPRGRLRTVHWFRWCAARGLDPLRATSRDVKAWLEAVAGAGAAPSTRDRLLATVKTLYAYLAEEGLVTGNPAALSRRRLGLTTATTSTSATVTLTGRQVRALHTAAAAPRRGAGPVDTARAAAVVALFTLGLRVSELCGLDESDLHVTRGRRALRVHGKGGKTRIVYLSEPAEAALTEYRLRVREAAASKDRASTGKTVQRERTAPTGERPLLRTRTGRRFQRQAIWQLLRRVAASAGPELAEVAEAMHPHALRHFYVTTAVEAGADLAHVQGDVGHSSIDTTRKVYDHAAPDPERSAVDLVAGTWFTGDDGSE
ncbi:Site-specific recombinase XerD [Prauserella aidingensis]|uniref:tyrosine-type recombinase/integrase n=1 Tax=Prauserella aidingensis TaxID=387890 RepID=UPI0020A489D5|nr:tyrosine-type recombinase/integrase [Prauserella aidingensis]MCP2251458.1 Site-specific recombinase XerD [Prauserella aidingensis]